MPHPYVRTVHPQVHWAPSLAITNLSQPDGSIKCAARPVNGCGSAIIGNILSAPPNPMCGLKITSSTTRRIGLPIHCIPMFRPIWIIEGDGGMGFTPLWLPMDRDRVAAPTYMMTTLAGPEMGRVKENLLPRPTSLSTQILPPWASTIILQKVKPKPVPRRRL